MLFWETLTINPMGLLRFEDVLDNASQRESHPNTNTSGVASNLASKLTTKKTWYKCFCFTFKTNYLRHRKKKSAGPKCRTYDIEELTDLIERWQPVSLYLLKKADKKTNWGISVRGFDTDYIRQFQCDSGGKSESYLKLILTLHKATKVIGEKNENSQQHASPNEWSFI